MRHLAVIELRETGRALLGGLQRPTHITLLALGFPLWDMLCLAAPVALAMALAEPPRGNFWHGWFLELPVWVSPTFSLLAVSRIYVTLWSRARFRDVLMLLGLLQGGILLSLGIALLIDPGHAGQSLFRALVIAALSQPLMIGIRVLYRAVEEALVYLRVQNEPALPEKRVLLYGAGGRCQLFIKERSFNDSRSFDGRLIAGLIDDDRAIHSQWIYGYQVLGGIKDLPRIVEKTGATALIITAALTEEAKTAARAAAKKLGIRLTEWNFAERELVARNASVAEAATQKVETAKLKAEIPATEHGTQTEAPAEATPAQAHR
jgi:FlaA1/EpsC-like NDP-sugar epimerase